MKHIPVLGMGLYSSSLGFWVELYYNYATGPNQDTLSQASKPPKLKTKLKMFVNVC